MTMSTDCAYWKRNDASSSSRAAANRTHSSAFGNYGTTNKSKYNNAFAYRGTSNSKDGLRSITSTGMLCDSKLNQRDGKASPVTNTLRQE